MEKTQMQVTLQGIHHYLTQVLGLKEIVLAEKAVEVDSSQRHSQVNDLSVGEQTSGADRSSAVICLLGEGVHKAAYEFWVVTVENQFSLEEQELTLKMVQATQIDLSSCKIFWSQQNSFADNLKGQSEAPFVVIFSDGQVGSLPRHQVFEQGSQKLIQTFGPQSVAKNQETKKRVWNDLKKMMAIWSK